MSLLTKKRKKQKRKKFREKKEPPLELKPTTPEFIPASARPTPSLNNLAKEFVPSSVEFILYDPNPSKSSNKQKYSGNRSKPPRDRPIRSGSGSGYGSGLSSAGGGYRGRQKQKQWVPKAKGKKLNNSGPSDDKWVSEEPDFKNPVTSTNGQTYFKTNSVQTDSQAMELREATTDS